MLTDLEYELIVALPMWRTTLRELVANPTRVATGRVHRDATRFPIGMVVERLEASTEERTGSAFPPLADWAAIAVATTETRLDPQTWMTRLRPLMAQSLTLLLVGLGPNRDGWRGWHIERGEAKPLAGFRVIGEGMLHTSRLTTPPSSSRWSRLSGAIGTSAFAKVREAGVAIVGCSRSGSLAAQMFAKLGVDHLNLIDADAIEEHNLDGMALVTESDIGSPKALVAGRKLVELRNDLLVKVFAKRLTKHTAAETLSNVDLIVTCVDHDVARLVVANEARHRLIPHLDIGTGVTRTTTGERILAADVRMLVPTVGCIECVGGIADTMAKREVHAPLGALPQRAAETWDARGRMGSLITLNSLAVSFGVQSWLDLLDGSLTSSIWHRLRWHPGGGLESRSERVTAGPGCRRCRVGIG